MYKDELNKGFLIRICYIREMIITCPSCKKQFEVDSNLIPDNGKLLQCGSCNETWFYNKNKEVNIETKIHIKKKEEDNNKTSPGAVKKKEKKNNDNSSYLPGIKGTEIIKYEPKYNLTFGKILSFIIVLIISFVALIIVLDTFKDPLKIFFPNIELALYNLFETLKDLGLFIKDLK